jgi:hypothetical protein
MDDPSPTVVLMMAKWYRLNPEFDNAEDAYVGESGLQHKAIEIQTRVEAAGPITIPKP